MALAILFSLIWLIAAGLIPRSLMCKNYFITEGRDSRMYLAGIQVKLGLTPDKSIRG